MFYKYPEIVGLEKRPEILAVKEVVAVEKLHGTNFRVLFPAAMTGLHELRFGGRNEEFGPGDRTFYKGRPIAWFLDRPELLEALRHLFAERGYGDVAIYGEVCGAGIQKGVRYATGDNVLFRAFDIRIGENFVTYDLFVELCDSVGLPRVPEVWRGPPSLAAFDALLERPSLEGERGGVTAERNLMEGVVIRSVPLLRTLFGDWLMIKHKCAKFEEVAKASTRADAPDLSPVQAFAETYVTQGRIVNALGRLRDAAVELHDAMEDMPHLVPAVVADLHKECEAPWQELTAAGYADKQVVGVVSKVVGGIYRRYLRELVST